MRFAISRPGLPRSRIETPETYLCSRLGRHPHYNNSGWPRATCGRCYVPTARYRSLMCCQPLNSPSFGPHIAQYPPIQPTPFRVTMVRSQLGIQLHTSRWQLPTCCACTTAATDHDIGHHGILPGFARVGNEDFNFFSNPDTIHRRNNKNENFGIFVISQLMI